MPDGAVGATIDLVARQELRGFNGSTVLINSGGTSPDAGVATRLGIPVDIDVNPAGTLASVLAQGANRVAQVAVGRLQTVSLLTVQPAGQGCSYMFGCFDAHYRAGNSGFLPTGGATVAEQQQIAELIVFLQSIDDSTAPFPSSSNVDICDGY